MYQNENQINKNNIIAKTKQSLTKEKEEIEENVNE
jgi:hypothetical protein